MYYVHNIAIAKKKKVSKHDDTREKLHYITPQCYSVFQKLTLEDVSLLQLVCAGSLAQAPEKRKLCSRTSLHAADKKSFNITLTSE